ncbi:hypothetical protein TrRE_jg2442 [Triparma retinervis]|uniref:Uncharacterized protein n=1 Tax=Triparma retinervis TaxID=2557542 RepID=A0A9W7DMW0_9STRA|nr:hypothetical protein TrRE_jg2442 [Triparma retinervis]
MQALHELANPASPSGSEESDEDRALLSLVLASFPVSLDYATVCFSYIAISKAKPTTAPFLILKSALESIDRASLLCPESEAFVSLVCCLMNSLDFGEGGMGTLGKIGKWALARGGEEMKEPEWGGIEKGEVANYDSDIKVGGRKFGFHFLQTLTSDPLHTFDGVVVSRLLESVGGDGERKKKDFGDSATGMLRSTFDEVVEIANPRVSQRELLSFTSLPQLNEASLARSTGSTARSTSPAPS